MNEKEFNRVLNKIFRFKKLSKNKFIEQYLLIERVKENYSPTKHGYKIGDDVILKKHNLMRGEGGIKSITLEHLEYIAKNGFISPDFVSGYNKKQKTPLTIPVWNIQEEIKLKDYIINYSGATIKYCILKNGKQESKTKLVPYNKINEELENSKDESFFKWEMEQTKEIRFMPSLARNVLDIAFIMDLNNEYGNEILKNDIFNLNFNKKILTSFISEFMVENFIYGKRDDLTTNRESAILYGIPKEFIVGILVSKKMENEKDKLDALKNMFPNCYICNLEGKVIVT